MVKPKGGLLKFLKITDKRNAGKPENKMAPKKASKEPVSSGSSIADFLRSRTPTVENPSNTEGENVHGHV